MAIIIPSKDIYEINNQKVVDNEVDNIEVEAKNVVPSNEFDTSVYNENFDVKENTQTINHEKSDKADKDYLGSGGGYHDYIRLASTSQLSLTYKTIPEIWIKKLRGKDIISQIYYKTDDEGNPNIKYALTAKIQTTNSFGIGYNPSTDTFNFYENLAPIDEEKNAYSYKDIDFSKTSRETVDINPPTTAVLQTELSAKVNGNAINTKASILGIGSPPFDSIGKNSAVSEIAVPVEEILSFDSVEEVVNEKEEYYVIKGIKICVGVLCKLGYAYIISSTPQSELGEGGGLYVKGAIIKIVPSSVQVTIYGDTIGIDLQDETVKIGDGQHVYSFGGNELMQTSNKETADFPISVGDFVSADGEGFSVYSIVQSPTLNIGDILIYNQEKAECVSSNPKQIRVVNGGEWAKMSNVHVSFISHKEVGSQIENYYNNIIRQWRNGKEVATIKCGMVDYYQSSKQTNYITVSSVKNISSKRCSISVNVTYTMPNKESLLSVYVTISGSKYKMYNISLANNNTVLTGEIDLSYRDVSLQKYELSYEYMETTPAISVKETGLPMTIHIGDTVIPYIKGADGNDKPMSYYMDKATPKEFLAIGKGITADGEILQELTLQEIPQV